MSSPSTPFSNQLAAHFLFQLVRLISNRMLSWVLCKLIFMSQITINKITSNNKLNIHLEKINEYIRQQILMSTGIINFVKCSGESWVKNFGIECSVLIINLESSWVNFWFEVHNPSKSKRESEWMQALQSRFERKPHISNYYSQWMQRNGCLYWMMKIN